MDLIMLLKRIWRTLDRATRTAAAVKKLQPSK
jgi:hypothetical protein